MKIFHSITFVTWVACLLTFSFTAEAQIQSYPAGGDWDDPLTWIGNTVPGPSDDVIIDGIVTISNFVACNNITLTSTGIVQNNPISYFILNINGNLINNGIIRNNPVDLVLSVIVNGDIVNDGLITNYEMVLTGTTDQHISCLNNNVYGCFYFTDMKSSGVLIADTDISFLNCIADLNNNLLLMPDNSKLSISGMYLFNVTILGNDLKLDMDAGAYIVGVSMGANVELSGTITVGTGVAFSGEIILNGTLQNFDQSSCLVNISGDLINNGITRNNPSGYSLILQIDGNLTNNGVWNNYQTKLNGTADQHVYLVNDQPILQGLQFLAMMGNESFEWFLYDTSLIGHPDFLGGGTPTLSFLFPATSAHYGIYNCYTDDAFWSRNIFLQSMTNDGISVNIKAFLEGPYNGSEMESGINAILPLNQPYYTLPWNYTGTESVTAIPHSNVVDWILVELRDATDAASANTSTTIATQAGFILNNGNIVSLDGVSFLNFNASVTNNLFIVIRHRNHLGVMSNYAVTESQGIYSYDFTIASDKAFGGTTAQKNLATGVYGMIGGDGNGDGVIDNSDKSSIWAISIGKAGYHNGDYNMNGQINNPDKNDIWHLNIGNMTQVP